MTSAELQILCEGPTESNFVARVLRPHLAPFRVFPRAIPLCKGNYGVVPFERVRKAVQNEVGGLRPHQFITTMIDLYGLREFPGDSGPGQVYERVKRIELAMAAAFSNQQVIPYIQVHEFEAMVFVDLDILPSQFPDGNARAAAAQLRLEVGDLAPEMINDGAETAPSKRLLRAIPSYNKVLNGPSIIEAIGLDRIRQACPHFAGWLARLEQLA